MTTPKPNKIRLLLVDDDEDDYLIVRSLVEKIPDTPFSLDWTPSFSEAKRYLNDADHDLYLIDYRLGRHSGLELLEFAAPHTRPEPFIILTGAGDKDIEKSAMKLGAADYLVKGSFDRELLSRTLHYALQRKQMETQRIQHLLELNQAKDEFISVASHQLRTPATGVKQYLGMVLEGFMGEVPEAQRTMLEKAYESNERQLRIVSDLLKVAQVDAGKVVLRRDVVPVRQLLEDILKEQRDTFAARQQTTELVGANGESYAWIDRDAVRMALENIIDNAGKYSSPHTRVTITIEDKPRAVLVHIQDEGVGIKKSDQSRLFQKFSRIENPLSTTVGGTGLGLYWAKRIIDLHDGRLSFTSDPGKGSTFSILLPKPKN